jgi:elongation factor G
MRETETGDSLCDPAHPALLERMRFPDPVISVAIEPISRDESDKLSAALYKMVKADPSLRLNVDHETGQTVLRGMGEHHLEVTIDRMRTELGVEAAMGKPRVSYREAFGKTIEHIYTHKKQTGGSGQFAEVKVVFEPGETGSGIQFVDEVVGGRIPREFIPSVNTRSVPNRKAARLQGTKSSTTRHVCSTASSTGGRLRARIRNRRPRVFPRIAQMSKPKLLNVLRIEVVVESSYLGDVISDINRRRGWVTEQGQKDHPHSYRVTYRSPKCSVTSASYVRHERRRYVHDGIRPLFRGAARSRRSLLQKRAASRRYQ